MLQGAEQDTDTKHKFRPNSLDDDGVESKPGEADHEAGEVKVGRKWEFPVAQTPMGMLWGTVEESRGSKRILAFRGIRHVQPPVGELR